MSEANGTLTVVDPTPPARIAPDAPPSIESILMTAVEKGTDVATLERLVALQERVTAERARQAYAQAIAQFRRECPPIVKNREAAFATKNGGKASYWFADLSCISKVIDPYLYMNGLSYSWDTEEQNNRVTVICKIRHVGGYFEEFRFASPISGAPLMSEPQKCASTITYCKRYSLVNALGLVIDDDDDGRATPMPQPDADPNAPKVAPRGQRPQQPVQAVPTGELKALFTQYCQRAGVPETGENFNKYIAWCCEVLGCTLAERNLRLLTTWTRDDVEKCKEAMM